MLNVIVDCKFSWTEVSLSQELAEAFAAEGERNNRERLLLAAAVGVGKETVEAGYEVAEISE